MGKEVGEISPHVFPLSVWRVSRTSLTKNLHPLVHLVPLTSSSDLWSFRLHRQFLAGPEPNGISYNEICRIFGQNWSKFRIYGQFSRSLRPVCEAVEAVDASVEAVDAVEAAGGISPRSRRTLGSSRRLPRCIKNIAQV